MPTFQKRLKEGRKKKSREKQLTFFFLLAYLVCFVLWMPLFFNALNVISTESTEIFFILGAFGPMISAFIITFKVGGLSGCKKLVQKIFLLETHYQWYMLAFFIPIAIAIVSGVLVVLYILINPGIELNFMDPLDFLLGFFVSLLIVTGEEFGWRGFALPRLQANHNALKSSLILGVLWSFIHFPLFFVQPERAAGVNMLIVLPGFVLLMTFLSIIITFLYNGSRGNILVPCIFHASLGISNHLYKSPNHDYDMIAMYLFIIVTFLFALFITIKYGYKNLAPVKRSVDY